MSIGYSLSVFNGSQLGSQLLHFNGPFVCHHFEGVIICTTPNNACVSKWKSLKVIIDFVNVLFFSKWVIQ